LGDDDQIIPGYGNDFVYSGTGNDYIIFEDHSTYITNVAIPTGANLHTVVTFSSGEQDSF